jgi:hypothetical protein
VSLESRTYRFVLDDGCLGEIITDPILPLKGSVPFRGSGPLYQPEDDT